MSRPDFVLGPKPPKPAGGYNQTWVVGELTLNPAGLYCEYLKPGDHASQFNAIVNYSAKHRRRSHLVCHLCVIRVPAPIGRPQRRKCQPEPSNRVSVELTLKVLSRYKKYWRVKPHYSRIPEQISYVRRNRITVPVEAQLQESSSGHCCGSHN